MNINLSYVLTTFNKLTYLKVIIHNLIINCKEDEEIVVTDGGSSDGSVEFLQELFNKRKIHQFNSKRDFGEAHGFNKAILLAKGKLIKLITDDDAFDYSIIDICKNYLLNNPSVDIVATNGIGGRGDGTFLPYEFDSEYISWLEKGLPFAFTGLGILFRKESLAIFGLLNTRFVRVDAEFTYRITATKINLVWHTGYSWFHIENFSSNSAKYISQMNSELIILKEFYTAKRKRKFASDFRRIVGYIMKKLQKYAKPVNRNQIILTPSNDYNKIYNEAMLMLKNLNEKQNIQFLSRNNES